MPDGVGVNGDGVRMAIWAALRDAGMWPDWETYEAGRARVVGWGEIEIGALEEVVGRRVWRAALGAAPRPVTDLDVVRMLGVGRLLSEHLLAPLDLPDASHTSVARLGGLANLIVALYDHFVDARPSGAQPLPREALATEQAKLGPLLRWQRFAGTPDQRFMGSLVRLYYRRLEQLIGPSARTPRVALMYRVIRRMYDAEELTRAATGPPALATLRRKAALPFVVMGLPGWLLTSPRQANLFWHLRWLYRLGLFFGQIDDAVDLEDDLELSHPNSLAAELSGSGDSEAASRRLAERIASGAASLGHAWRARVGEGARRDPVVSRAVEITTCSWFGGSGWKPSAEAGGMLAGG